MFILIAKLAGMKMSLFPQTGLMLCFVLGCHLLTNAQPVLETGGKPMPGEWIDQSTGHRVIRLVNRPGNNMSFYFHNNPFAGDWMVFYGTDYLPTVKNDSVKQETGNVTAGNKQLYSIHRKTRRVVQLTHASGPMNGEIVAPQSKQVYYQIGDSVFATGLVTGKTRLVFVFPDDFKGSVTTVNADETLLAGVLSSPEEKELLRRNPDKSSYFNLIFEAKLPRTLFTIDLRAGKLEKVFTDSAWLNHVQFSPTDSRLLMFCHEGPWHKLDRIWTLDLRTRKPRLMHRRTMDMEIAGHEWFSPDGKTIWFDLQQPKGERFFVAGVDVRTGMERKYSLTRDEWSIHFSLDRSQRWFCGDGGDSGQVAHANDGQWIYFFTTDKDRFRSTRLVNMQHHNYKLEPNVHFSPDGRWIIFRANFEGNTNIYAVER